MGRDFINLDAGCHRPVPLEARICFPFHDLLWTSERHPSHEPEPGALEVTVEGERDRNFASPHDG